MRGSSRSGNVYDANCPTRLVLDRVADKWSVLVLGLLAQEPIRFNELRRRIDGISQKMLAQVLRQLERDGLINRKVTPTVPVTVEYSITPLGRTLSKTDRASPPGPRSIFRTCCARNRFTTGRRRDALSDQIKGETHFDETLPLVRNFRRAIMHNSRNGMGNALPGVWL